jgi:hypothetical protein
VTENFDYSETENENASPMTAMSSLEEEFSREVQSLPELELEVPARPGVVLYVDPNIEVTTFNVWSKRAASKHWRGGLDSVKFAGIVLANQTQRMTLRDGVTVDRPFADRAAIAAMGADDGRAAVLTVFGREADLVRASNKVLDASGLGADDEDGVDAPGFG